MRLSARKRLWLIPRILPAADLTLSLTVLGAVCVFIAGCSQPAQPKEQEPPFQPHAEATPAPQISALLRPNLNEVQDAVERVFKDSALIQTNRNPSFVVGDFNGDASQDLAVVLKPAPAKLSDLNREFPPWILKDALASRKLAAAPLRVAGNDILLAVIHGFGPNGWRDTQATQTYLLKNAAGTGVVVQAKERFIAANAGKQLPRLRGDLIAEVLRGAQGYLYYDEATYSWYDPKSFKGEPERRLVHSGATSKKQQ